MLSFEQECSHKVDLDNTQLSLGITINFKQLLYKLKRHYITISYQFKLTGDSILLKAAQAINKYIISMSQVEIRQRPSSKSNIQSHSTNTNDEANNIYYTKNKRVLFWLYLFASSIFLSVQIYLTTAIWDKMEAYSTTDNIYYANQVVYEWSSGYITDIKIVYEDDCPDGYENSLNYYWPGTGFGCYCDLSQDEAFVLQGYCSANLIQSSCVNIKSQEQKNATNWKGQSKICVKKSEISMLNQERYNKDKNIICGNSKSSVVMPPTEPCPLVNISFILPTLEENYKTIQDPKELIGNMYASYNSTSPYSFYGYPISKFKISEYEFCLLDEDSGLDPDHIEFRLLNYEKGCLNTTDYNQIDSVKQIQFYEANPNLKELTENLGFPKPGNWEYKLGFNTLPSWNYDCRHNYDSKFSMQRTVSMFNFDYFDQYYYLWLVTILLCIVVGLQIFILGFRRLMKKEVYPVGYRKQNLPKDFCLGLIRYIVDGFCKICLLGLFTYCLFIEAINWDWFKAAINLECFDGHIEMRRFIMEPYRDLYTGILYYTLARVIVTVVIIIIDVMYFSYIYKNELSFYLINQQNQMVIHQTKEDLKQQYEIQKQIINIEDQIEKQEEEKKTDKFRITMDFNLNDQQLNNSVEYQRSKRIKPMKKKNVKTKPVPTSIQITHQFNPYSMDDQTFLGLDSKDELNRKKEDENLHVDQEDQVKKRRKKRRGRYGNS